MTSIFSNTRSRVHVTILHDATLTADNRRRFERTAERWKQSVSFVDVEERMRSFGAQWDKWAGVFTRGTLFRLLIPELLPVPKVLYLDCDIVVNLDLAELWATPLDNASLAAVKDPLIHTRGNEKMRSKIMGSVTEEHFNSGVLLMNLQRIREKYDLLREARDFFARFAHVANCADQDYLNVLFLKDVVFLEERFNRVGWKHTHPAIDRSILHLTGKPWKRPQKNDRDALFWKTFSESEWGDQMNAALLEAFQNKSLSARECVRELWRKIPLLRYSAFCDVWFILINELGFRIRGKIHCERTDENGVIQGRR
jgi:lipopolysaccharide biosynthesis glycosyltransferase